MLYKQAIFNHVYHYKEEIKKLLMLENGSILCEQVAVNGSSYFHSTKCQFIGERRSEQGCWFPSIPFRIWIWVNWEKIKRRYKIKTFLSKVLTAFTSLKNNKILFLDTGLTLEDPFQCSPSLSDFPIGLLRRIGTSKGLQKFPG